MAPWTLAYISHLGAVRHLAIHELASAPVAL